MNGAIISPQDITACSVCKHVKKKSGECPFCTKEPLIDSDMLEAKEKRITILTDCVECGVEIERIASYKGRARCITCRMKRTSERAYEYIEKYKGKCARCGTDVPKKQYKYCGIICRNGKVRPAEGERKTG